MSQRETQWQAARHLQTLCWMIIGMIQSQNVHLNGFGMYVVSRAQVAQSHQRRFRRWLANRRINEDWTIVSDEPTNLQTFAQYRLRFQVEASFLALKSNGFNLEASRLRDKFALFQLCGVIALTMLFLVLRGVNVVVSGQSRQVDAHWNRGMSDLKLGWNWVCLAITQQWKIQVYPFLSSLPDPQPAFASKRQQNDSFKREFTVLSRLPAS